MPLCDGPHRSRMPVTGGCSSSLPAAWVFPLRICAWAPREPRRAWPELLLRSLRPPIWRARLGRLLDPSVSARAASAPGSGGLLAPLLLFLLWLFLWLVLYAGQLPQALRAVFRSREPCREAASRKSAREFCRTSARAGCRARRVPPRERLPQRPPLLNVVIEASKRQPRIGNFHFDESQRLGRHGRNVGVGILGRIRLSALENFHRSSALPARASPRPRFPPNGIPLRKAAEASRDFSRPRT